MRASKNDQVTEDGSIVRTHAKTVSPEAFSCCRFLVCLMSTQVRVTGRDFSQASRNCKQSEYFWTSVNCYVKKKAICRFMIPVSEILMRPKVKIKRFKFSNPKDNF